MADCGHLTDAELGIYIKILMFMWRAPGCRLPNDDAWLARKFGRSAQAFENEVKPIMREFCQTSGNFWTQKRLLKEYNYMIQKREKNREAANARWGNAGEAAETPHARVHTRMRGSDNNNQLELNEMEPCGRNAPTPTPTPPRNIITPTSPRLRAETPVDNSAVKGVLKNFGKGGWRVQDKLTERGIQRAKEAAPGWDIYHLMNIYNEGIQQRGGVPDSADAAFPAWCKRYTKGKSP